MTPNHKSFLLTELPALLRTLPADRNPNFGLMTAQHMVEHLTYVTKAMVKRRGEPSGELNKSQRYFRKFIDNGAPFEYRPRPNVTKDSLQPLRSANLEEAIVGLEKATADFYDLFASKPDHKSYSEMMGEFNLAELELFHYQHGRWHAFQFSLISEFSPFSV
ncbi:MAG: hypothetical protein AB8G22_11140 [Saprospiraceae bacterium]